MVPWSPPSIFSRKKEEEERGWGRKKS
uniref:Uncharacterized protein n=1 Tax=Arundo donax TaxID=35708 RepID=A0A0A9GGU5_ARUDO